MYAFLGLVRAKDLLKGNLVPVRVLCIGGKTIRVMDTAQTYRDYPKLLFTELWGHEDMIRRMYEHRQKEFEPKTLAGKPRRSRKLKKRPRAIIRGKVFWFLCDMYGNPTGEAIMVEKPEPPKEEPEEGKLPSELWSEEKYVYPIPTDKKLSLPQHTPPSYHGRGRRIGQKRNYVHPNPFGKGEKE